MTTYEKSFKEKAVKLSDEIDVKKAAQQLHIPYLITCWQTGSTGRISTAVRRTSTANTSEISADAK